MDQTAYSERLTQLAQGTAVFDHHDLVRLREEDVAALKMAVGWAGDEDFYSNHDDSPAKRAAKVLLKHYNSAQSIEREAMAHAKSEATRGPAISRSNVGA